MSCVPLIARCWASWCELESGDAKIRRRNVSGRGGRRVCTARPRRRSPQDTGAAPLLNGLGKLHHPITTSNPLAQRYFDQGLTLVYAFNHEEAARSFEYAARLDPKCAMAYWGVALARGPNYNESEIDASREKIAAEAIGKAQARAAGAGASEQAYIRAMAKRVSLDPKADQKKLGANYRDAMRELMKSYPNDMDAAVLFADAIMDLHAWKLWKKDGKPEEGTLEAVQTLESVLKRDPDNIGANHFYIHVMEASPHPEQAMASAQRLAALGARRGPSGSHAGSHLHSHGRLSCLIAVQQTGHGSRPGIHRKVSYP